MNNAFRVATSTDRFAVPDTLNGNRVALLRAPAAGAGFTAADATTTTATTPAATTAPTVTTDEHTRARLEKPITHDSPSEKTHGERQGPINDPGHSGAPGPHLPGQAVNLVRPRSPPPDQRTVAPLATTTKTTNASMDPDVTHVKHIWINHRRWGYL